MIRFNCPKCDKALKAEEDKLGAKTRCPKCGQSLYVPPPVRNQPKGESPPVNPAKNYPLMPHAVSLPAEEILDVLPADPEDFLTAIPVEEPPQRARPVSRFYEMTCPYCGRNVRIKRQQIRNVQRCPNCGSFLVAPVVKRPFDVRGLPVTVSASAFLLMWPRMCVCCCKPHDTYLPVSHTRIDWLGIASASHLSTMLTRLANSQSQHWKVPYCWECLDHVRLDRDDRTSKTCWNVEEAIIYHGWYASVHTFKFFNPIYASLFIRENAGKILL